MVVGHLLAAQHGRGFGGPHILTRNQAMTAPVAVVNFMNYEGWEWGKIAAGGTMVMLPVLIFSILVRKFLIQGMTTGAVKG